MTQATLAQTYQQAWSAEQQGPSGRWTDSTWDKLTFRVLLDGAQITRSGSTVWLTLKGRDAGAYTVERVSLIKRDRSTLNGVGGVVIVTFGGTWDDGVTVPSGASVMSDPIAFDLVAGQDVFVTFWCPAGSPPVARTGGSTTSTWIRNGTDLSGTTDWETVTIDGTRAYTYGIEKLEVMPVVVPPSDPPAVGSWVQTVNELNHTVLVNWPDITKPETKWTVTLDRVMTDPKPRLHFTMDQGGT